MAHGRCHRPGNCRRPHHHRCARSRRSNGSYHESEQARYLFQHRSQVSPILFKSADYMHFMTRVVCARRTWRLLRFETAHGASLTCSMRCLSCTTETPRSSVCWAPRPIPLLAQHLTLRHSRVPRPTQGLPQGRLRRLRTHRKRSTKSRRHLRHQSSATTDSRLPSGRLPLRDHSMRSLWTAFTPTQTLLGYASVRMSNVPNTYATFFPAGILCTS